MRLWETPVPIPNTTVKTQAADGTILETVWESRWMPDSLKKNARKGFKQNRHIPAGGEKGEARDDESVNPFQQGIAVI